MADILRPNFEEKGKLFTEVITKICIEVIIQTTGFRIYGKVHVRPGERLKDELDRNEPTLAVTDAIIYDAEGKSQIIKSNFVAVQKPHIIWILPDSEPKPENQGAK